MKYGTGTSTVAGRALRGGALLLLTAAIAACGGKQQGAPGWDRAVDAIPEHAAVGFASSPGERDIARSRSMAELSPQVFGASSLSPLFEGAPVVIDDEVGVSWSGEIAAFVRDDGAYLVARVADGEAYTAALREHVAQLSYGQVNERRALGGTLFTVPSAMGQSTDALVTGSWTIVRVGLVEDESAEVVEQAISRVLRGEGGRAVDSGRAASVRARLEADPRMLIWTDHAALNAMMQPESPFGEAMQFLRGGLSMILRMPQGEQPTQAECDAAGERIATMIPGLVAMSGGEDAEGRVRSASTLYLSPQARERASQTMRGTFENLDTVAPDAILATALTMDFGRMVANSTGSASLMHCSNLGALQGLMAAVVATHGTRLRFNARTVSGEVAFVLHGVNLEGLFPTVDAALVIGSPDPESLHTRIQRQLPSGATAQVLPEASVPTVVYSLAPVQFFIQQFEDRLVLVMGNMPHDVVAGLATTPVGRVGQPATLAWLNGDRLSQLLDDVDTYVEEMGMNGGMEADAILGIFSYLRSLRNSRSEAVVGERGIEGHGLTEFR